MKYLANLDLNQNELQNVKIQNLAAAPENPVKGQIYFNTASSKYFGHNGSKWVDLGYEHPSTHTIAQISGLQSALDGKASSDHAHSQYANQNAFSNVKVGTTTVAADTTTDTLEIAAGANITITPDATTDKITIAANVPAHPSGLHVTQEEKDAWNAKESTTGSQAKANKALADAKSYADTKVASLVNGAPEQLDTLKELADAIEGNQAGVSDLLAKVGTKAEKTYVDTELAKKAASDHNHDTKYAKVAHDHGEEYLSASGTAVAATKLATPRTINGVAFDGSASITITDDTKVEPTGSIVANRVAIFGSTNGKVIKDSGFTIASNVPANAKFTDTVYTHPANHPATVITQDASHRFVTDTEKNTWNGKAAGNHNHNGVYARKYAANIGNGTLTTIPVTHNLGTEDVTVSVKEVASKELVMADVVVVDTNNIQILFASAPASNAYRVVVIG